MGSYGGLYVGSLEVMAIKNRVWPELCSVFTDDMYRTRMAEASEFYVDTEPGKMIMAHEFVAPGHVIADRLEILGFVSNKVHEALNAHLDKARERTALRPWCGGSPELEAWNDAERDYLTPYTVQEWMADVRSAAARLAAMPIDARFEAEVTIAPGTLKWLLSPFEGVEEDERLMLRAVLLACPDEEVRLDVTDLVGGGWLDTPPSGICSTGLSKMRAIAAIHAPVVVLTEGKSDIAVLEPALRILYPHLVDLIRFMDYGERPQGGAGPLVNTVRSFAAAGIANRVVALFDNDTAACDALRSLDRERLPGNIRVCQYPDLDIANNYPTIGPPPMNGRPFAYTDVNGLAGSIEMYLGRDILALPDGILRPVQWRTYIPAVRQYQGEITGKQSLHDAYYEKVRRAEADRSKIADQDWSGIRAIFDLVFNAFQPED